MRICFINPPIRDRPTHIPYGIAQLISIADQEGISVAVEDCNIQRNSIDEIIEDLRQYAKEDSVKWDMFAFSGMITTYGWQKDAIKALKREFPETFFIAGGGCASGLHDKYLNWVPELDAIAIGEGDETFMELMSVGQNNQLWDQDRMHKVKGLWLNHDLDAWNSVDWRKSKKKRRNYDNLLKKRKDGVGTSFTGVRPLMPEADLDLLPYPGWKFFLLNNYRKDNGDIIPGYFSYSALPLSLAASVCTRRLDVIFERGCAGRCKFCSHNLMGGDFIRHDHVQGAEGYDFEETDGRLTPMMRYFSPEYVVSCIEFMRMRYAVDFISFMDETMLWNLKRTHRILDLMEDSDSFGTYHWGCLGRVENADEELFTRLKDDNCTYISYGFEASHQPYLDYLQKGNTVEQQQQALDLTKQVGIQPHTTYILGYPNETMQGMYDTAKFMVKNGITVKPFFLTPYLYTQVYWEEREKIMKQYDGDEEKFVLACGDAYDFVVNLTDNFQDGELIALQHYVATGDLRRIREHSQWRADMGIDEEWIIDTDPPKSKMVRQ